MYFVPRIPMPIIRRENEFCNGEFLLFSKTPRIFFDIQVSPTERLHIADPIMVSIEESDYNILREVFCKTMSALAYRINAASFDEYDVFFLPLMKLPGKPDLVATIDWAKRYLHPVNFAKIYRQVLKKHDKKSNGKDLGKYINKYRVKISEFFYFFSQIDVPIDEFIEKTEPCRDILEDKHMLVSLFACFTFAEKVIERVGVAQYRGEKYQVVKNIAFGNTIDSEFSKGNEKVTFRSYFNKTYNIDVDFDPLLPLIEVIPPKEEFKREEEVFENLSQFPNAYSLLHYNTKCVVDKKMKLINELWKRFTPSEVSIDHKNLLPLELVYYKPCPRPYYGITHLLIKIIEQMKPHVTGDLPIDKKIKAALRSIKDKTGHLFQNWKVLTEVLIDPTYKYISKHYVNNYQRIEYLGDAIIDLIVAFALYNGNPNANEGIMSQMKIAMVKNNTFSIVSYALDLPKYIITTRPENYGENSKATADLFEAFFGALFIDSNIEECFRVFALFVEEYREDLLKRIQNGIAVPTFDYIISHKDTPFNILEVPNTMTREEYDINLEELSAAIGHEVNEENKAPFITALTHRSFDRFFNYERLEFVGDIIVKFAIASAQFIAFPNSSEAGMSIAAGELKSNAILGRAAYRLGLHKFILIKEDDEVLADITDEMINDETFPISKVFGDLFEAMTAAIAGVYGLSAAINFVHDNIIGTCWKNDADKPNYQPKAEAFIEIEKKLKTIPTLCQWTDQKKVYTTCDIKNVRVPIIGESTDHNMSEQVFGRQFLKNKENIIEEIEKEINEVEKTEIIQEPFFVIY